MPIGQALGVGDEQIVADQLALVADQIGERFQPSQSSSTCRPRSRRSDSGDEFGQIFGHLGRTSSDLALALHLVLAVLEELGRGASSASATSSPGL
jgi:hypothetical protein